MEVNILRLYEGAKQAEGITVIIDVFRAFSLETCLFEKHAEIVYPVSSLEEAYAYKKKNPDAVLIGERNGVKCEGFDFGNTPSEILKHDFTGRTVVHTTSSGTQGLSACTKATRVFTGSLRNAKATANYIKSLNPEVVSLVAMGWCGERDTEEDILCAEYLKSLLLDQPMKDIQKQADDLRFSEGKKFFDPEQEEVFPKADFFVCTAVDVDNFAIEVLKEDGKMQSRKVEVL